MRGILIALCCIVTLFATAPSQSLQAQSQSAAEPSLDEVLRRMSQYVAAYGAQAAMFVGTESYTQTLETSPRVTLRQLRAEFAVVKPGTGNVWVGYRDVTEVNGKPIVDRQDRLLRLLSSPTVDAAQLKQIDDENARYNVGPVSRNFNVPTTALFFFDPDTIGRFSFHRRGTEPIDGVSTWVLEFKETRRPTLVRTRSGHDVPCNGRLFVVPADGTIVRTHLELSNFADRGNTPRQTKLSAPTSAAPPPTATRSLVGGTQVETGSTATQMRAEEPGPDVRVESKAIIEVTYRLDAASGAWLPSRMSESYQGARIAFGSAYAERASAVAEYSDFKRFQTSAKIVLPK